MAMTAIVAKTFRVWILRKVRIKWLSATMDFNAAGVAYENSEFKKALRLLENAAKLGHARAQFNLAVMYENGIGVLANPQKAFEWYGRAAAQGNVDAQFNLGVAYTLGEVVTKNYDKALDWYHKAAAQGQSDAQNNLGVMYDNGVGVAQNAKLAERWFCFAINHDNAHAQYNLGKKYARGFGVTKNVPMAYALMSLSLHNGMDVDDEISQLETIMTANDFAQAKQLMAHIETCGLISSDGLDNAHE
jgi:TPR repeat protein